MGFKLKHLTRGIKKAAVALVQAPAKALNHVGRSGILGVRHSEFRLAGIRIGSDLVQPLQAALVLAAASAGGPCAAAAASGAMTGACGGDTKAILTAVAVSTVANTIVGASAQAPTVAGQAAITVVGTTALAGATGQNPSRMALGALAGVVAQNAVQEIPLLARTSQTATLKTQAIIANALPVIAGNLAKGAVTKTLDPSVVTTPLFGAAMQPQKDKLSHYSPPKDLHHERDHRLGLILGKLDLEGITKFNQNLSALPKRSIEAWFAGFDELLTAAETSTTIEFNSRGQCTGVTAKVGPFRMTQQGMGVSVPVAENVDVKHDINKSDIYPIGVNFQTTTTVKESVPATPTSNNINNNPAAARFSSTMTKAEDMGVCRSSITSTSIHVTRDLGHSDQSLVTTTLKRETHLNAACIGPPAIAAGIVLAPMLVPSVPVVFGAGAAAAACAATN